MRHLTFFWHCGVESGVCVTSPAHSNLDRPRPERLVAPGGPWPLAARCGSEGRAQRPSLVGRDGGEGRAEAPTTWRWLGVRGPGAGRPVQHRSVHSSVVCNSGVRTSLTARPQRQRAPVGQVNSKEGRRLTHEDSRTGKGGECRRGRAEAGALCAAHGDVRGATAVERSPWCWWVPRRGACRPTRYPAPGVGARGNRKWRFRQQCAHERSEQHRSRQTKVGTPQMPIDRGRRNRPFIPSAPGTVTRPRKGTGLWQWPQRGQT